MPTFAHICVRVIFVFHFWFLWFQQELLQIPVFLTAKPQGKNILSYKNLTDVSWYYLYAFKISRLCSFHIFRSIDRIFLVQIYKFQVSIVSCFQILE